MEAVLAIAIILSFLLLLSSNMLPSSNIERQAFERLEELDRLGMLRESAATFDYEAISSIISLPFPHSVEICAPEGNCQGQKLGGENVAAASYIIAGSSSYSPREVRIYVSP